MFLLLLKCCLLLVWCYLSLFSVSVNFWFTLLAEIVLVSEIVECVKDCVVCRRLWNESIASRMLAVACVMLAKLV